MARPEEQSLVLARGVPAPQIYDANQGKYVVATGVNGVQHVEDKESLALFNNLIKIVTEFKKETAEEDLVFIKKADAMPSVKTGLMVYVIDTNEVYVPYKGKWEVLQ